MAQWIAKLDGFLRLSGREILTHAGRMTAEAAQGNLLYELAGQMVAHLRS